MKYRFPFFLFIVALMTTHASLLGQETETRDLAFFDAIDFAGSGRIHLQTGDDAEVKIEIENTNRVALEDIETEVRGRTLHIYFKEKSFKSGLTDIDYYITYPALVDLYIKGAAHVSTKEPIRSEDFNLYVEGADRSELELDVVSLNVHIAGAGYTKLYGQANVQTFQLDGAGSIHASDLEGNIVRAVLNGVGSMRVYAREMLEAQVNGVGNITYSGDPKRKEIKKGGLGSVKPEG